jgi:hypothetical protein
MNDLLKQILDDKIKSRLEHYFNENTEKKIKEILD